MGTSRDLKPYSCLNCHLFSVCPAYLGSLAGCLRLHSGARTVVEALTYNIIACSLHQVTSASVPTLNKTFAKARLRFPPPAPYRFSTPMSPLDFTIVSLFFDAPVTAVALYSCVPQRCTLARQGTERNY